MPLITPRPSRATTEAFRDGLAELIELGRAPADLPEEGFPLRVYNLSLNNIVRGKGVRNARTVLWEFLVTARRRQSVLVSLKKSSGGRIQVTSIAREPIAPETAQAIRRVTKLAVVNRNRYELRLLRIPALWLRAFWLKSLEKEKGDLAVPYQVIHDEFQSMHSYPMEEFLAGLRPVVEKHIKAQAAAARRRRKKS